MAEEMKILTPEVDVVENAGTLVPNTEEVQSNETEEINTKLLEQISHKLDLLLSIEGGES